MKNFFLKSKKEQRTNPGKWSKTSLKFVFFGVATIFQPATPKNVIVTDDAGGNSYISVTTGQRVTACGSKSAEIPCFYLC